MLTKFEVQNFKNFSEKLTFDLTQSKNYGFNNQCIVNGIVDKAIIYGHNASGKSNLGLAIFDIISHMTDKESRPDLYNHYITASSDNNMATFKYYFEFDGDKLVYEYGKSSLESIIFEKVTINDQDFVSLDRRESTELNINAVGAETLKKEIGESKISVVSYLKSNAVLAENKINSCFNKFIKFVEGMLFFRSLNANAYIGYEQGTRVLAVDIIEKDKVEDFQNFLNNVGIECKLFSEKSNNKDLLYFDFNGKYIPFDDIASNGTRSLELFYYWYIRFSQNNKVSFIFIDEFDAFYHHELAKSIVELLKNVKCQIILTTHNVSIMSNDLLRPDCYFLIENNEIKDLSVSTDKEIREAHNLEKMYRAGKFDV